MQTQYNFLSYRGDLYFHDYKHAIEIDENGHSNRNIEYEIKQQNAIEQELGCKFLRIHPDKEEFDIFRTINKIFRHIKQSTKKVLIRKISTRLLGLEFKSNKIITSKAMKFIVKKILPDHKQQWKRLASNVKKCRVRKFKRQKN